MEARQGLIVRSKAGRDAGDLFIILRLEDQFAYIANGDRRKVDCPKKKKLKHLQLTGVSSEFIESKLISGAKITNNEVRIALAEYLE